MFSTAFLVFLGVFVFFLFFGAPIYLALLCGGLSYVFLHGGIQDMAVMAKMYGSLDNFVLLAIPMFMMAGKMMNTGGITDRIFGFCRSVLGSFPGGLAYVNVLASFIFSGMSGSALADVGGLGAVEIKAIRIAASYMMKQNSGVIINASSFASLIPHANGAIYAATKAGVSSLTRSTGAALAPYGIRVLGYIPGMIQTGISEEFISQYRDKFIKDISLGRLGVPEDLAKPIVFLSSDAASYITACDIQIAGGKFAVQDCAMPWRMKKEKEEKK